MPFWSVTLSLYAQVCAYVCKSVWGTQSARQVCSCDMNHEITAGSPHVPRYESKSLTLKVTNGAAISVNFTLTPDNRAEWSETEDFGIAANMAGTKYLNNDELQGVLNELAAKYPAISSLDASHLTRQVCGWKGEGDRRWCVHWREGGG